jgi:hypothetical protein
MDLRGLVALLALSSSRDSRRDELLETPYRDGGYSQTMETNLPRVWLVEHAKEDADCAD